MNSSVLRVNVKMRIQVVFLVTVLMSCSLAQPGNDGVEGNKSKIPQSVDPPKYTNSTSGSSKKPIENESSSIKNDENKSIKDSIIDIFKQQCQVNETALKQLQLDACDFKETNTDINLSVSCLAAKATAFKICTRYGSKNISTLNSSIGGVPNITEFCSVERNSSILSDKKVIEFFKLLQDKIRCPIICGNANGKTLAICLFIDSYYQNQTKVIKPSLIEKTPKQPNNLETQSSPSQSDSNGNSLNAPKTSNVSSTKTVEKEEKKDEKGQIEPGKIDTENDKEENDEEGDTKPNPVRDSESKTPTDGSDPPNNENTLTPAQSDDIDVSNKFTGNLDGFVESESSHFFTYFLCMSAICILFYVAMCNKKKILALVIEGRRTSVKRRPNSAAYSKLDCNLEEALLSGPSTSSSNTLLY